MKAGASRSIRRLGLLTVVGALVMVLTACTGRGGGYLPPGDGFTGQASFGFTFSCEDKGGINRPTGRLGIQLSYTDGGRSLALGAPFSIHGIVDTIDPVLESAICIGQNPPPGGNELIFLGRYRRTTASPPGFPASCPTSAKSTSPLCRFEVIVRDNDGNLAPSPGDFFSIKLSSATASELQPVESELDPTKVFYARAGLLRGGNITVK